MKVARNEQIRVAKVRQKAERPRSPEVKPFRRHELAPVQAVAPQVAYRRVQANGSGLTPANLLAMQRERGNLYVQRVVAALASMSDDSTVIQRQQIKKRKAAGAATTTVGPPNTSTYAIEAESLADVTDQVSSMGEAGKVEWRPNYNYDVSAAGKITGATVTVPVYVSLPIWNPPADTGPKTKAEWNRARNALKAHEDGHVQLVQKHCKGLANKLIGKTPEEAQALFDKATADLQKESDKYDVSTDHGKKTGTVIDVSIEEKERKERVKKSTTKKPAQ